MIESLIPFRHDGIVCPKCSQRFRLFTDTCWWQPSSQIATPPFPECLLVRCPVCKFDQLMATANAPAAQEQTSHD